MLSGFFHRALLITMFILPISSLQALALDELSTEVIAGDRYLGAIPYNGGLMERGRLFLTSPEVIQYLRFDMPSHCRADVFEAGTTTEGVDDLAEQTRDRSIFAVNAGRGNRSGGVFLSLNGASNQSCYVLVFSRTSQTLPPSNPPSPRSSAITCIENPLNIPVSAQLNHNGNVVPVTFNPLRTSVLTHPLSDGEEMPQLSIVFDRDISPGAVMANYILLATRSLTTDCTFTPRYRFVSVPGTSLIDLVRFQ
jgi:hypothetical protein